MLTLHIQLLGDFRLSCGDAPVSNVSAPRLQALLAYLLLHRHAPQPRQHLAFLLWPDTSEAQARTNLRQLLHGLKQALPQADQFMHADAQTLQWRSDAPFHLDVAAFEAALAQADAAEQQGDAQALRVVLEQAIAIYGGELLPSCYDDWIVPERERLRQAFSETLERLTQLLESQDQPRAAIPYAQRLVRHDPLCEETYRALMRLHAECGDRCPESCHRLGLRCPRSGAATALGAAAARASLAGAPSPDRPVVSVGPFSIDPSRIESTDTFLRL